MKCAMKWEYRRLNRVEREIFMARIADAVLNVLEQCRVEGNILFLPSKLDRKDYLTVNKVLESLGGKWNRKAKGHIFPEEFNLAEMLNAALVTGEFCDSQKEYQFYPTPREVALQMCEMTELSEFSRVLEPSCGDGRLADVIAEHHPASLLGVELNPKMCQKTADKPYRVIEGDFLKLGRADLGSFDRIVMNPPFSKKQEIDHISHAYDLLEDGGILVSVASEGVFFREDRKTAEFRSFLKEHKAVDFRLREGAFRESGTAVPTRLIKIRKEDGNAELWNRLKQLVQDLLPD